MGPTDKAQGSQANHDRLHGLSSGIRQQKGVASKQCAGRKNEDNIGEERPNISVKGGSGVTHVTSRDRLDPRFFGFCVPQSHTLLPQIGHVAVW